MPRSCGWAIQNGFGSLFRNHQDGRNDKVAWNARENGSIDHTQVADAINAEVAVDHPVLVLGLHCACPTGVVAPYIISDVLLQLVVGIEMAAGRFLLDDQIADSVCN